MDGRAYRTQTSIFSNANTSATDKVCAVFLLPHVFGHRGACIPANVRESMMTAIARTPLMLIAVSGRREYTKPELCQIFDEGYTELFKALEHIRQVQHDAMYSSRLKKHTRNPDRHPAPKRFKSHR